MSLSKPGSAQTHAMSDGARAFSISITTAGRICLLVNGHAFPEVEKLHIDIHYKDRAILYRNLASGKFRDVSNDAGPALAERHSARGAAFGDMDNDGMIEIAVNNQNEAPSLWKQAAAAPGNWLILKLTGTHSNRSAMGRE